MSSLYELTAERLALQSKLESLDLDTQTIQDTLEGESTELQAKLEDYGFVLRNRDGLGSMMRNEIERMESRLKAHERRTDAIKDWLLINMQRCQITKIDCPAFSIALKTNPPSVIVDDEKQIPSEYWRIPKPPEPVPDKTRIKTALQSGQDVPGCHIEQRQRVVIE